ncbi:hypothetical protein C9J85_00805 [Haloferax sp. wsp5]|nr:hypothetical protein C9J85_00805 [Haloferax sp. wsp5]
MAITIERDGDDSRRRVPVADDSQNIGSHYGDNYTLGGDGVYQLSVRVNGMGERRPGALEGRFDEAGEATVEATSPDTRDQLSEDPDAQGERATVDLMMVWF